MLLGVTSLGFRKHSFKTRIGLWSQHHRGHIDQLRFHCFICSTANRCTWVCDTMREWGHPPLPLYLANIQGVTYIKSIIDFKSYLSLKTYSQSLRCHTQVRCDVSRGEVGREGSWKSWTSEASSQHGVKTHSCSQAFVQAGPSAWNTFSHIHLPNDQSVLKCRQPIFIHLSTTSIPLR